MLKVNYPKLAELIDNEPLISEEEEKARDLNSLAAAKAAKNNDYVKMNEDNGMKIN